VTIHSEHPFLPPEGERNPVRRLRGRLTTPVTLWTAYDQERPVGLTVSSMLVADGEPGRVLGLIDPDSDLYAAMLAADVFAVSVLTGRHSAVADAFAGVSPAPGGAFRLAQWERTAWGPVLAGPASWAGCRIEGEPHQLGWGQLVTAVIERVELSDLEADSLAYRRGRYLRM
jgi:flavin reductase (DIM6/NTAB) family NADH-FMN oxidoreductase RutF